MPRDLATTHARVNEIDLLRFMAALAVVFFHYSFRGFAANGMSVMPYPLLASFSKYGYLGVELFFIISGFVILMTASSGSLRDFTISRMVRLYPAFWACCTFTFLVTMAIGGSRFTASVPQLLINLTMLNGFVGVPSIDGAYWSLFVEMRFYALVGFVLIVGRIRQAEAFIVAWLLASIVLELIPVGKLRYLFIVDFSAYFIAGATFFLVWSKGMSPTRLAIVAVSWSLALLQSMRDLPGFEKHYSTHMDYVVVAAIISSFFVVMLLVSLRLTGRLGSMRWVLVGAVTYPLYLLHQNFGFMVFNLYYPSVNSHLLLWGMVSIAIGMAVVVHVFVERRLSPHLKSLLRNLAVKASLFSQRATERIADGR